MTREDKVKLIVALGNFQRDEWDNLTDDEFLVISQAIGVITMNAEGKGRHYEIF